MQHDAAVVTCPHSVVHNKKIYSKKNMKYMYNLKKRGEGKNM